MTEIKREDPEDYELPGLATLAATPEILRALLATVGEEQTYWKPAPDRWSIAEILEHMSHIEGHMFRTRVDAIVKQQSPSLVPYDQEEFAASGQYSGRDAEDSFDHFEEQREDNVEMLATLTEKQASRVGIHPVFGVVTLAHVMNSWAFHDLGHIRQIAEIIRASVYYEQMGPFAAEYKVHP